MFTLVWGLEGFLTCSYFNLVYPGKMLKFLSSPWWYWLVFRMIPLVVGFQVRCRSWLCAKPFSRDLPISEPDITAEVGAGSDAFPVTPTPQSRKGRFLSTLSFLFLDSRFRRFPGLLRRWVYFFSSFPDPTVLVSFELSDWWRWLF